ncbi:hypothetical protein SAMN05192551_11237 [Tindallia magadiensis]|uniref:ATP-binding protein n=1 Tax=Tindallia magadiensis TaxID=69895 RepID=A0A1I3HB51_9FIRM|nr:ATP-binding protein [Tindallia magadiensis]SFI32965.1 hypothetical protein SAMN05192551_11237 [Tindallia magadiensis]
MIRKAFLGRDKELAALEKKYHNQGFQMMVLYGRRRVGKTSLIQEFCKNKPHMLYIAIEQNDTGALEAFSREVLRTFPRASAYLSQFDSWENVFRYLAEEAGEQRFILAIDEYPYMASGNPSISSILQKIIDTVYQHTNLYLILCGSSMSFMERQVLGYQSPLYGRRTGQIKVLPFDYRDSGKFFPIWSKEDCLIAYGVTGGVPQYLQRMAMEDTVWGGIEENFLSMDGYLFEEPSNLLKQELREPAVYNSIVAAIAQGAAKINEIATKTGEDARKCTKYIHSLMELGIVKKEIPIGEKNQRKSRYFLEDHLFRFWYRFIPANMTAIQAGRGHQVLHELIRPRMSDYVGITFEAICRQYLLNHHESLPFIPGEIGRWWGNNPVLKCEEEIDLLGVSGEDGIFAECKWRNEKMSPSVLDELIRKRSLFKEIKNPCYYLFSKSGFTDKLQERALHDENVTLVDLNALFIPQK